MCEKFEVEEFCGLKSNKSMKTVKLFTHTVDALLLYACTCIMISVWIEVLPIKIWILILNITHMHYKLRNISTLR